MIYKLFTNLAILLLIGAIFSGCSDEPNYEVDLSDHQHDITIYRMDRILFEADTSRMKEINQKLIQEVGPLYDYYVAQMVQSGSVFDPAVHLYLNRFVTDSTMKAVVRKIDEKFGEFDELKQSSDSLFRHFKHYFPSNKFPDTLVVYNSVFTNGVISTPSQIGVGAEMYLGPDNEIIKLLPGESFPQYFKKKMKATFLIRDIAESWLSTHYIQMSKEGDFLAHLIYYGKIQYALNLLLPAYDDAKRLRFFPDELSWFEEHEEQVWKYLVEQKWIYSKDKKVIRNFFNEAPFTSGLPEGAPAKAGIYMGKKIVEDYMETHPETDLKTLFQLQDHQKILKTYNPEN